MKEIKIYLRSIENDGKKRLSLFDTNRQGNIDDLVTEARRGSTVIWAIDKDSGIKDITGINPKSDKTVIFKNAPVKRLLCKGFKLKIPKDAHGEEDYGIEYILSDGTKQTLDPRIRIIPPS